MSKLKIIIVIACFVFILFSGTVQSAANQIDLYFFEGQGCPHCSKIKSFIDGLKKDFPNLKVYEFEVYFNAENQALFEKMARAYGAEISGVPTLFIDEEVISGADFEKVKNAVERCSREECVSPLYKTEAATNENQNNNTNLSAESGQTKNEIVGWVAISFFIATGIVMIIYILRRKKNV